MLDLYVVAACLVFVVAGLAVESWILRRMRRGIPLRIAVIGTRGKSSVTRLIAAGLRADGRRVVYKTTGSAAVTGDPEANEHLISRWSTPSPLEQRGVLRRATRWKASALVVEAMSIRPESLSVELRRILCPHIVVVTNVRSDHVADLPDPGRVFADAIPHNAHVVYAESAGSPFREALASRALGNDLVAAEPDLAVHAALPYIEWPENVALAVAACVRAGARRETALGGMIAARPDTGALAAWRLRGGSSDWIAVNAFAANDPESTAAVLRLSTSIWWRAGQRRIGLLSLRRDRGDRTQQWFAALAADAEMFDRVVLIGDVPRVSARIVRRAYGDAVCVVRYKQASRVMEELARIEPDGGLLFGFGNIGGLGIQLVRHWSRQGEAA